MFRYFPTKEDIVMGKFRGGAQDMLDALRARPADEPVWLSLRRMLDRVDLDDDTPEIRELQQMVFATPALLAVYLRVLHDTREAAVEVLRDRAAAAGTPYAVADPVPRALVAAAFGCLEAAQQTALDAAEGEPTAVAPYLDRAMDALTPLDGPGGTTGRSSR